MKKPATKTSAKKKAWDVFSKYIRLRDALLTMHNKIQARCISCQKPYPAFGRKCLQAGHFLPGRRNSVLFHEDLVHAQCYNCNVNLGGNWVAYERVMIALYGQKKVDEFKKLVPMTIDMTIQDYQDIEAKFRQKIEDLGGLPS